MKYVVDPIKVLVERKFPLEALNPRSYGFDTVEFPFADYSTVLFTPTEPASFVGVGKPRVNMVLQSLTGASFDGFEFATSLQVRACIECTIRNSKFSFLAASPLRIRFGSHRNKVEYCSFQRTGPIPSHDVVGILFTDGPNHDNEICNNTILNYTDAIQLGRGATDAEISHTAGTYIHDNVMGITAEYHKPDGSMMPGLEQAGWDLKTGGTADSPIKIERNLVFGCRTNAGSPGYACTYHLRVDHVVCMENTYVDCESVHFLNATYDDLKKFRKPTLTFEGEHYIDIRNHGFASPWPGVQGSVFCGVGAAKIVNPKFIRCDRWEAAPVPSWFPQREWVGV